jgi:FeS assembly SUF system protein
MSDKPERISLSTTGPHPLRGYPVPPTAAVEPPADDEDTGVTLSDAQREEIKEQALAALRTCYDPELPVNIVELGLIYYLEVMANGVVKVDMTLTAPNCPAAGSLPAEVRSKIKSVPGVFDARVRLVWDPPWTQDRMSEAARLDLGLFG